MKKPLILVFILTLVFSYQSFAQTVSMSSQTALPGGSVSFPIVAAALPTNIGAATIYILIDTNVIKCTGHTPGTMFPPAYNINFLENPILISWSNPGGLNINGTILTLNFKYKGGSCALDFTSGCEIATAVPPDVTPVTYIDGSIAAKPTTTYYVDAAVASSGNGLSWGTALKRISEATNKPLTPGDKVLIKPATYIDTVIIKSNGTEIVPLTFNVAVSDTNKITFPAATDLGYIDLVNYPGKYYAYLGRSWKGNNGVYKITQVNKTLKYVIVEGAEFVAESGAAADSSLLQAAIGFAIIYEKSSANPLTERVILSPSGISGERAALHIGKPTSTPGDFNVNAASFNIIDGIDITGADQIGVRIQNSQFNVFKNARVYELDSIGILISGNSAKPANNNYILNNSIYNTNQKAIKIGIQNQSSPNNRANLNHIKGNEIYSAGAGTKINFFSVIDICRYTGYTVLESNTIRNLKLKSINRGAIEIRNDVRKVLAYANFIKNIDKINTGTHSIFYLYTNGNNNKIYNNVMVDTAAVDNDIYAFWVNVPTGSYTAGLIGFNTVHKIDNGFKLVSGASAVDLLIKNNIMNLDATSPDHFAITGAGLYAVSYNCYATVPAGYVGETGRIVGSPSFLLPTYYQSPYGFALQTGSICLNTGNPIAGITTDLREKTRNASTPSRGAFEQVLSSAHWTGEISTSWHDYRNWDVKMLPLTTFNVIIPDRANDPVITSSNITVKTLLLNNAAQIRVSNPRILTITN